MLVMPDEAARVIIVMRKNGQLGIETPFDAQTTVLLLEKMKLALVQQTNLVPPVRHNGAVPAPQR